MRIAKGRSDSDPDAWHSSSELGGSPGLADPEALLRPHLRINEVLSNPEEDGQEDAVEIINLGEEAVDLSTWFLSDSLEEPRKFRIPEGSIVEAGERIVFYEEELRIGLPGAREAAREGSPAKLPTESKRSSSLTSISRSSSSLSSREDGQEEILALGEGFELDARGDGIYLTGVDERGQFNGFQRGFEFGALDRGRSIGRIETDYGPVIGPLESPSFGRDDADDLGIFRQGEGASNIRPLVGPIVISEIMYRPDKGGREFVEIVNISDETVRLGPDPDPDPDSEGPPWLGWRFDQGIRFEFPPGSQLEPGQRALIVESVPSAFRDRFGLSPGHLIFGPFEGRLSNGGERLSLSRPALGAGCKCWSRRGCCWIR